MLTASEIYSVAAESYDRFWVQGTFNNKPLKAEGFQHCEDESEEEMRKVNYVLKERSLLIEEPDCYN